MPKVLEENTHPEFPSSPAGSRVDEVGSQEPHRQEPVFIPGVDADQCPKPLRALSWGPLEVASWTSCIVVEGHSAVGIDNHQVIILGIGYQCGGCWQGPGESQTGFHRAQTSGG